jgi:hypothetical protein
VVLFRRDINIGTVTSLPLWSAGPGESFEERVAAFEAAGIAGVQADKPDPYIARGFIGIGQGRIDRPQDAFDLAARHRDAGYALTTVHVGTGIESDDEADRLAAAILESVTRYDYPLLIETHRATITQDIWRTINLIARFPDLRFNADLSHWYLGCEMPYGDFEAKLAFMTPLFDRVRYIQPRVASSGSIQIPFDPFAHPEACRDNLSLWRHCCDGFRRHAAADEVLGIAPELLPDTIEHRGEQLRINYARKIERPGFGLTEDTDRWIDALGILDAVCELIVGGPFGN